MGTYIDFNDLKKSTAYMAWLSGSATSTEPNRPYADAAIDDAEGDVKAHLGASFTLPLADANETKLVKNLTKKLTMYYLYLNHESAAMPDKWDSAYDRCMKSLEKISKRLLTLGADTATEKEMGRPIFSNTVRG